MRYPDLSGGACLDADPDLFHEPRRRQQEAAKRICHSCPILEQCREGFLRFERGWSEHVREGIYGGMTPEERRAVDLRRWPDAKAENRVHAPRVARKVPA